MLIFLHKFSGTITIESRDQKSLTEHPGRFFGFENVMIYTSKDRTYYFSAATEEEKNKWVKSLRFAIQGINEQVKYF